MSDLSNEMESFKLRSRRHRKRALKALQEGDGEQAAREFGKSREAMNEALSYLRDLGTPDLQATTPASDSEIAVAEQMADCWGMLGGVDRAQGYLVKATTAYDEGYKYESSGRFNILNTYNRVNRLVVRVLRTPEVLSIPPPLVTDLPGNERTTMPELLADSAREIERQLREGRTDRAWALADCAMVRLLGGLDGVNLALDSLDESSANDPFPFHSTLNVIRELAQKQLPMRSQLIAVGERLRQKLPQAMQGESISSASVAG